MSRPARIESDLSLYPAPHLAVDLVLLTIEDNALAVLMHERTSPPFAGRMVLPGGFVHPGECLDDTARRVLREKAGLEGLAVEQLHTFSDPGRDPRGWVVSVAYFALVPHARLVAQGAPGAQRPAGLQLVTLASGASLPMQAGARSAGRQAGPGSVPLELRVAGRRVQAGFDHQAILSTTLARLRGKLDGSMLAFALLPERFTLHELQRVHEVILGRTLNKPQFRKRMLERCFPDGRRLAGTGTFLRGGRQRPAELHELRG